MTVTWGLDMSTDRKKTGLVRVEWDDVRPATVLAFRDQRRSEILRLIKDSSEREGEWWAVDVPFGWPTDFVDFLGRHHAGGNNKEPTDLNDRGWRDLALRKTDVAARLRLEASTFLKGPTGGYSVSFDKLGATAAAWAGVEAALRQANIEVDRSGSRGFICETWPSAAWRLLVGADLNPAKMEPAAFANQLSNIVDIPPTSEVLSSKDVGQHMRDALVCALVARARQRALTDGPPDLLRAVAQREGWIHLPKDHVSFRELV